jgi:surface polysaccharide O-acyltransferase-like enzyme
MIGGLLFEKRDDLNTYKYRSVTLGLFVASIVIYCICSIVLALHGQQNTDFTGVGYSSPFVLIAVCALFTATIGFEPARLVRQVIEFIGKNTLGIYFIHWILIGIGKAAGIGVPLALNNALPLLILYSLTLLILSSTLCWTLRKVPFLRRIILI